MCHFNSAGRLVARYECVTQCDLEKKFTLEVIEMDETVDRMITTISENLIVQRASERMEYVLTGSHNRTSTIPLVIITDKGLVKEWFQEFQQRFQLEESRVFLLITKANMGDICTCLDDLHLNLKSYVSNPICWDNISSGAKENLIQQATLKIQNFVHTINDLQIRDELQKLEGFPLNGLLRNRTIDLSLRTKKIKDVDTYVPRGIQTADSLNFFENDKVYVVINGIYFRRFLTRDEAQGYNHHRRDYELADIETLHQLFPDYPNDFSNFSNLFYERVHELREDLQTEIMTRKNILTVDDVNDFEHIIAHACRIRNTNSVQLIYFEDNHFDWKPSRLVPYLSENQFLDSLTELNFLTASPGEGKSTFLFHISKSFSSGNTITLLVTARELMTGILKAVSHTQALNDFSCSDILRVAMNVVEMSKFEMALVNKLVDSGFKFTLLLDGVCELPRSQKGTMDTVLEKLREAEPRRVTVLATVRCHAWGHFRNIFNIQPYSLLEMPENHKLSMMKSYWEPKIGVLYDPHIMQSVAIHILRSNEKGFKCTAMICRMLAEEYLKSIQEFFRDEEFEIYRMKNLTMAQLYEATVERNFEAYIAQHGSLDKDSDLYLSVKENYIKAHMFLAFKELYPADENVEGYITIFADTLVSNIELIPGQGFIDSLDPARFTHRTYADHFLDMWSRKVINGELIPNRYQEFGQFFREVYINSNSGTERSLNHMYCDSVMYRFTLDRSQLRSILDFGTQKENFGRILISSLCKQNRTEFLQLVGEWNREEELIRLHLLGLKGTIMLPVYKALLVYSLHQGYYDLFKFLIDYNLVHPFALNDRNFQLAGKSFSSTLHLVVRGRQYSEEDKLRIIDFILATHPELIQSGSREAVGDTLLQMECCSFKLIKYIVSKDAEVTGANYFSGDNLVRKYSNEPDYMKKFKSCFPTQFYELINCSDGEKGPPWWNLIKKDYILTSVLNTIDLNVKSGDGNLWWSKENIEFFITWGNKIMVEVMRCSMCSVSADGTTMLDRFFDLFCSENTVKTFANFCQAVVRANSPQPEDNHRLSKPLFFAAFYKYLGFCESQVSNAYVSHQPANLLISFAQGAREIEHEERYKIVYRFPNAAEELAPYYIAAYVKDYLEGSVVESERKFQKYLFETVLARKGVRFKYPVVCYLLNEILEGFNGSLPDELPDEYHNLMQQNDSAFIVACKSAHVNIAKLLLKSFTSQWVKNLSEFELMCFFRAVDQHCGDEFMGEIVIRLKQDETFAIPLLPVQEALVSGNHKLFRIYVEDLGFVLGRWGELGERGVGLEALYLVMGKSLNDSEFTINRKIELIGYLQRTARETMDIGNIFDHFRDRSHSRLLDLWTD